jgi:uncharacterized protein DUF4242
MPKFVIERDIPGMGKLIADQLHAIAEASCGVLNKLGRSVQWVHSYVNGDKIYCIYNAPKEEMWKEETKRGLSGKLHFKGFNNY